MLKISVIIPVYNVSSYLEKCLESIKNQTLKDIEIIVVNDGSTDNSLEIIQKFARDDDRFIIINKENGGLSSARNAGIKIAKAPYIQHIDGDDWVETDYLESTYNFAKENDLDAVVVSFFWSFEKEKRKQKGCRILNQDSKVYDAEYYLRQYLINHDNTFVCNKLFKTSLYTDNNISHPEYISMNEDTATSPKLLLKAKKIGALDKAFYHYRIHSNSMSQNKISKQYIDIYNAYFEVENFFKNEKVYEIYKNELIIFKVYHLGGFAKMDAFWGDEKYEEAASKFMEFTKEFNFFKNYKYIDIKRDICFIFLLKLFPFRITLKFTTAIAPFLRKSIKFYYDCGRFYNKKFKILNKN